jgi:5-methylcytosine-specific restriction protein B
MLPDYDLLEKEINWIKLSELLEKLNNRIEYLLDKDHLIGHSYFMQKMENVWDLKLVIYNEILPLLEEYFYWENEKIRQVLWSKLFEKKNFKDNKLFEKNSDFENDENQYEINKDLNDEDFISAIKNIIKFDEKN